MLLTSLACGLVAEAERQHYNVTLAILTVAGTAYALQQTMVIPALPALQRDLHTTTTWVTWVLTALLLVASVSTPPPRQARRPVRQGAAPRHLARALLRRLRRRRGGVEHLGA